MSLDILSLLPSCNRMNTFAVLCPSTMLLLPWSWLLWTSPIGNYRPNKSLLFLNFGFCAFWDNDGKVTGTEKWYCRSPVRRDGHWCVTWMNVSHLHPTHFPSVSLPCHELPGKGIYFSRFPWSLSGLLSCHELFSSVMLLCHVTVPWASQIWTEPLKLWAKINIFYFRVMGGWVLHLSDKKVTKILPITGLQV